MVVIRDFAFQGAQMLLVLLLAPALTGLVRVVKARLLRRQGPPLLQPYRDLIRLLRKEVVLAHSASWLFRVIPYLVFAGTWVAASLVPTFRGGLLFSWSADLIALIAAGQCALLLALAGLDVGTSFGGIGPSREVMIACSQARNADDRIYDCSDCRVDQMSSRPPYDVGAFGSEFR